MSQGEHSQRSILLAAGVVLGVLALYLALAASLVDIEYYDGYDTLCNARFFLGQSPYYIVNRSPLMGLLMAPAEWLRQMLGLHPLDVRVVHSWMAVLHVGYLALSLWAVFRCGGRSAASLLAFVLAVPTYLFFSYSPFLSHDLMPGAMCVCMVLLAESFMSRPTWRHWLLLVVLGAAAASIKHVYGVIWAAVLAGQFAMLIPGIGPAFSMTTLKRWGLLLLAGMISGAITWLALALVLRESYPNVPMLATPWQQIREMLGQYDNQGSNLFPVWMFARNFWAFGITAMVCVLPALLMQWLGNVHRRPAIIAWVLMVAAMHMVGQREVRYLAFLSPLTAVLIVPAVRWMLERRLTPVLGVLLALDCWMIAPEAAQIFTPFYQRSQAREFLAPLDQASAEGRPALFGSTLLSFPSPVSSPLRGDRYHHQFHLAVHHPTILLKFRKDRVNSQADKLAADTQFHWEDGTMLILSNVILVNDVSWRGGPIPYLQRHRQVIAQSQSLALRWDEALQSFAAKDGQRIQIVGSPGEIALRGEPLTALLKRCIYPRLYLPDLKRNLTLSQVGPETWRLDSLDLPPPQKWGRASVYTFVPIHEAHAGDQPRAGDSP